MKKIVFALLSCAFAVSVVGQSFELTPASIHYNAEPGESQTKFIHVKNHSSKVETFILNVSDYSENTKGQGEYLEAGSVKNSIADWLSISPIFFELQPNEEKEITATIQVPADEYGSKWGVIFVKTAEEQTAYSADKNVQTSMNVSGRMAINVYQTPRTNKSFEATITNLSEVDNSSDSLRFFNALVNNLGDVITPCKVYLIATNVETMEEIFYPAIEFTMYPKSSRRIELEMERNLPKGTYSLTSVLDYGSRTNLEGAQMIMQVE